MRFTLSKSTPKILCARTDPAAHLLPPNLLSTSLFKLRKASLNSIEFSLREFNTGSFPRGLSFMLGALSKWVYDQDPLEVSV